MGHAFIAGTVVFTVYGQLIIKHQINRLGDPPGGAGLLSYLLQGIATRPLLLSGFVAAFLASLCWMAALTRFDLSYAYPFMALNFVLVVLLSVGFFDEVTTVAKLVGLALICAGVLVVASGS